MQSFVQSYIILPFRGYDSFFTLEFSIGLVKQQGYEWHRLSTYVPNQASPSVLVGGVIAFHPEKYLFAIPSLCQCPHNAPNLCCCFLVGFNRR